MVHCASGQMRTLVSLLIGYTLVHSTQAIRQQSEPLLVTLANIQTQAQTRYNWTVSNKPDRLQVSAPTGTNTGFGQVSYTVAFTRTRQEQVIYVLSGSIVIQDTDIIGNVITLPVVKVTPPSGVVVTVPSSGVSCPALAVPAGKAQLVCTFEAQYTGNLPLPGSVVASVAIAGTSRSVTSQPVQYDFSAATLAEIGAIATVSNYFEQGTGIMQPYGISGLQPPPGLTIEDTRVFTYLALFGQVDTSKCNQQWKTVSTAEVKSAASPNPARDIAVVAVTLLNCEAAANAGFASQVTPAPVAAAPVAAAPVAAAPAPALLPVPAATPTAAAPAPAPVTRAVAPVPAGITFAEAGSTICGGGACGPNQRCFDGWNCCDNDVTICGGICCDGGRVCLANQCTAAGSTICGPTVCPPGSSCTNNVCCPSTGTPCGSSCCDQGQICLAAQCAAAGSTQCGSNICGPTQQCVSGTCCGAGETSCGGRCCASGNICLQNQFCVPAGSSICAGSVCSPPQACAGGQVCCDQGATACGGVCCPSGLTCQQNRCIPQGSTVCGSAVCSSGQSCQGGNTCCNQGETFCNNGCCAVGLTCINNQCVVQGSVACGQTAVCPVNQFCGNSLTGLCCQTQSQIACGTSCCPFTQQCNTFTQQCVDRVGNCGAGEQWCPNANRCCSRGQTCFQTQCVDSNNIGGGGGLWAPRGLLAARAG